ncbi:MAG: alpha/beta hydrolase [Pseudomonadota bacterium]
MHRENTTIAANTASTVADTVVRRRAVFFIGGYDPKSAEAFFDRLDRETERFEDLWEVETRTDSQVQVSANITCQTRHITDPENRWHVKTDFNFVCLDSIVQKDFNRPLQDRVWRYLKTFADYNLSGTGLAFMRHAWRFWFYFMYPFTMLALGFVISLVLGLLIATSGVVLAWLTAPIFFGIAMTSFIKLVAKPYFVFHLMDLWSFSADIIHRRRPDMDAVFDELAAAVAISPSDYDEIIMVGHSTGGALILEAAARALDRNPDLAKSDDRFWIMTVGSTSLKVGLHPDAQWYRHHVNSAMSRSNARWVEYQCQSDIINFSRTNPAKLMGFDRSEEPYFKRFGLRVKRMVSSQTYKRIKRSFFRVHYQFVFGNTRRYFYDFPAICFGPARLALRVAQPQGFKQHLHPGLPDSADRDSEQDDHR